MPGIFALIDFDFDPLLHIAGMTIRWQTIGVTIGLLIALALAALMAPDVRSQRPFFRRREPDLRPLFPAAPKVELAKFTANETRFGMLAAMAPRKAEEFAAQGQAALKTRYELYKHLATPATSANPPATI